MPNENKILLRQLNPLLDLSFSNVSIDHEGYHATAAWPVNILALVLEDGGGNYYENLTGNQRLPILADHVYLIPCGLRMRFEESPPRTVISLHFNLTFLQGFDIFSSVARCEARRDPALVARIRALLDEPDELKAVCALKMEVMRFCLSCWPENLRRPTPALQRKYEPLFRFVREHGDASLTVGALAAMAGQRPNVFSRNFSRDIGKAPKDLLQGDLLKKVAARLLAPGASVKQVAEELKFCSEFYLSRFFKKRTGLSPSDYQRRFRHRCCG